MDAPAFLLQALDCIDGWLAHQKLMDPHTPGYAVAVSRHGETIYKNAFGLADRERGEAMTPAHLFRIASHSKTFTAVAIMQLAEAGKLDPDAPAASCLPFLNENRDPRMRAVTIRRMMAHTSGIARDGDDPAFWTLERPYPSREELESFFRQSPACLDGNSRFKYSNHACALLGMIIEELSGMDYVAAMRKMILNPLGIPPGRAGGEFDPAAGPHVTGYAAPAPDGRQAPVPGGICTGALAGATGFYADAESLCRFYSAVMPGSGLLLSDETKREMLRRRCDIPDENEGRGYACGFASERIGKRILNGHAGGMPGNITKTLFDPEDGIVVSIMTNALCGPAAMLQKGVWHIVDFIGERAGEGESPLSRYAGRFYSLWENAHYVPLGEKLYKADLAREEPFADCPELEPAGNDRFRIVKDSGYGSYGEDAVFTMENGAPVCVRYAGYPQYGREDYLRRYGRPQY